jgi:hypothetical protein
MYEIKYFISTHSNLHLQQKKNFYLINFALYGDSLEISISIKNCYVIKNCRKIKMCADKKIC